MASESERDAILRILDANRNRSLEALRVLEDLARFARRRPEVARALKALRHDLSRALGGAAFEGLLAARDVAGDPGHPERATDTRERAGLDDVRAANLSRAKESLRALEELAKPLDPTAAAQISRVRYAVYELESALVAERPALAERGVYVLLGSAPGRPPVREQARACLAGGVRLFQLREKTTSDREALTLARDLVALLAAEDALLIVNDRPDLALAAGAAGVHLGRDDLPAREARRVVGFGGRVGASAHDAEELEQALAEGVDHLGVGTLFSSPTKPGLPARGVELVRELRARCGDIPLFGIGGVTAANAASVIEAGADGVAVAGAVLDAGDADRITAAAAELVSVVAAARARRDG